MGWNDTRVEILKKLWADGLSGGQIAAELGGITRNAVIGKVHRLGLTDRAKSLSSTAARPRKARAALALALEYEIEAKPELVDNIIPIGQRRNILELTDETCRWPVGDPGSAEFFFCGGQTSTGSYCNHHFRVAYRARQAARHAARDAGTTARVF